jgi:hypothetical protein
VASDQPVFLREDRLFVFLALETTKDTKSRCDTTMIAKRSWSDLRDARAGTMLF